jgi:RNA polymerase sigma factor (TIGR02999 family)
MSASPPDADAGFFPLVYDELRRLAAAKLAGEPAGHTLDATALVHEAYLRLGDRAFADRSGFLRAAAVAMQRILVDHARGKRAARRGGRARQFAVGEADRVVVSDPDTVLDVAAALTELAAEDVTSADVARLRLFAGLSIDEAALALGLSRATAFREWAYARSWLTTALAPRGRSSAKAARGEPEGENRTP